MLEILNRYAHGLASIPILHALREHGCLSYLGEAGPSSAERLAHEFSANRAYLDVGLRMLVCLDWVRLGADGRYQATPALASYNVIPDRIMDLYRFPFDRYVQGRIGKSLDPWLERSERRWNSEHPYLPDFLDGLLVVPLLLSLIAQGRVRVAQESDGETAVATLQLDVKPAVRRRIERLFVARGWASRFADSLRVNRAGRFVIERVFITGTVASYRPMFEGARELLFGDAARIFGRDSAGHETHVDRTMNVTGSGFQHEKYFAALSDLVVRCFDGNDFAAQPKYIVDMGCGDGTLLRRLYEAVRYRTRRGKVLEAHPVIPVAVDFNEKALAEASRKLAGIEHIAAPGDIGDPAALLETLRANGVEDLDSVLHVRSFLDHDRPYRQPENAEAAARRSGTGGNVYLDSQGQAIPPGDMLQSTVEHLRRWSQVVNEHGLVLLEVHCLPPEVTARYRDESESFHFDLYHALSHQYLLDAHTFLACAAEASLFCREGRGSGFPKHLPYSRISLNHFERRPYLVRRAHREDLPALAQLEEVWPQRRLRGDACEGEFVLESEGRLMASVRCDDQEGTVRLASAYARPGAPASHLGDLLQFVEQYWALTGAGRVVGLADCRVALPATKDDTSPVCAVARDVRARVDGYPFAAEDDPRAAEQELGAFSFRWVLAIFQGMGVMRAAGEVYKIDALAQRLGVAPRYRRYFDALMRRLQGEGLVTLRGRRIETTPLVVNYALTSVVEQAASFERRFRRRYPASIGLLNLTVLCLHRYEEIITGRIDVADVVFEKSGMDVFTELFQGGAVSAFFNRIVGEAVRHMVVQLRKVVPKVRIIEIGAGTGATTAAILEVLHPFSGLVDFCFSDISPSFIRNARRRFAERYPSIEYRLLNIEEDGSQQGFEGRHFDIVVAANVLHDTRDIERALRNVHRLLRPGGLLVIDEYTAVKDALFFSGALLHGYWLFEDPERRLKDSCLLSVSQWFRVLERTGFAVAGSHALPSQSLDAECSQSVMLCEALRTDEERLGVEGTCQNASSREAEIVRLLIEQQVLALLGDERASAYSPQRPLMDMGLDSIELVELKTLLAQRLDVNLSPTFLFEHETPEKLTVALSKLVSEELLTRPGSAEAEDAVAGGLSEAATGETSEARLRGEVAGTEEKEGEAVAIVGVACRLPGGVMSAESFWRFLDNGSHGIVSMSSGPSGRWQWPPFIDPNGEHQGIDKAGFLARIDEFDASFFRISPREAELMDPQQRFLLELSWEAMEDAGHRPTELSGRKVGVFVGVCHGEYREVLTSASDTVEAYLGTGSAHSLLANRLSYFYDFKGPSLIVDTACASSLFALHEAVIAIRRGDCEQALVGAANLLCSPTNSVSYYRAGMLSATGGCRTFDEAADGYVRGEGAVVLLLKPLATALAEGDSIYGLIKGTAVNHGGQAASLTAPKPEAQAAVIQAAWQSADLSFETVGYIETHGTGTRLGDPIEIRGLFEGFRSLCQMRGEAWPRQPQCGLGSVKTNIGHLESAAGLAGLVKVLMAIRHGSIPASLNFERLNPEIDLDDSPFYIVGQNQVWPSRLDVQGRELPRRAGVSSFGFGGANAHIVIEEFPNSGYDTEAPGHSDCLRMIPLSARNKERLIEQAKKLLEFLESEIGDGGQIVAVNLGELAYTLQVGREAMEERVAFVVQSKEELKAALHDYVAGDRKIPHCHSGHSASPRPRAGELQDELRREIEANNARMDMDKLASLWVKGAEFDWPRLYPSGKQRRIHAPTYAFARERYWAPAESRLSGAGETRPHPLVHQNTSGLGEQRFSSTFTGEEFFLAAHRVAGQRLLPAVAYLEMAREASAQAMRKSVDEGGQGAMVTGVKDVVWLRPLVVGEEPIEVHITLFSEAGGEVGFEVYSDSSRSAQAEDDWIDHEINLRGTPRKIVHCQGRVVLSRQPEPGRLDLEQLKIQMRKGRLEPSSVYASRARKGLAYGSALQGITTIHQGSRQLLAHLSLPRSVAYTWRDFVLHPSLIDSALQACMELIDGSSNQPQLPFSLESLRIVSPCTQEMVAWARYSPGCQAEYQVVKLDLDLCDEQGNVCVEMRGFSTRVLKSEEGASLLTGSGLQSFVPVWNPVRLANHEMTMLPGSTKILLLGDNQSYLDWVRKSHPNAYLWPSSSTSTIESMEARLKDCSFDHLLWIAGDVALTDDGRSEQDSDQVIDQQETGVLAVFRIIKALLRLGYGDKELSWTIITSKTQRVKKDESVKPTHAGIFGQVGSLAKEYPHWKLSLLDVDSLESVAADACLSMVPDRNGNGLAYRHGEWFKQEFAQIASLPQLSAIRYRTGGVYIVIGGAGGLGELWSRFMIEHYRANMVWIGLRKYDAAIESKINSLERLGPAPLYISADASIFDELEQAFKTILRTYPAVHGVVHSAIRLNDKSIALMEEPEFRASLSAKVDISVNVDRVFGEQELDFILLFSSIISFIKSPGQSNYAAGCTFKDSFAQSLQQRRAYPVKIMNWGYWGEVGVVADEYHNQIMERMGVGSIEPKEGLACLQTFVDSELNQAAIIKIINSQALADIGISEKLTYYHGAGTNSFTPQHKNLVKTVSTRRVAALEGGLQTTGMDAFLAEILASSLISLGLFKGGRYRIADLSLDQPPAPFYERWLRGSIHYLQQRMLLSADLTVAPGIRALGDLWLEWNERKIEWAVNPNLKAQVDLLEACLKSLPQILSGKQTATDVMFPDSSMRLVEGVYQGNAMIDYFNEALGDTLAACIEHNLAADRELKIRILEIGAGTGGTTTKLLPLLQRFPLEEYCYTDISKAFLMFAEEQYQPRFPQLTTAIFDVSRPLALQSIPANHYDVVIATNVLHATPNIRETLRNTKATMKNQGVLILNEISSWSLFTHLTFGLLEGWWLHEDTALRMPWSPGLAPEKWREILGEEGFESIFFPAEDAHKFGQQIIAASSDGWVRQQLNQQPVIVPDPHASTINVPAAVRKESANIEESLREKAFQYFKRVVSSTLKMRPDQIETRRPLSEYGLDSILVGQLTYQLRKTFSNLTSTLFFEVQSIEGLVNHFLDTREQELALVLRQGSYPRPSASVIAQAQESSECAQISLPPSLQPAPGSAASLPLIFDVAIIGLSGRYPQSKDLQEFWANISNGVNCITEIPEDRWRWEKYYHPEKNRPGKIYTKWGGFIEGIDQFDPLFFKISPKEAKRMDPQERKFLESCYHAIEDAGYTPEHLGKAEKIGVFVGVMNSRYTTQPAHSSIANRVSYVFNFQGPSLAIDTACSSSLTALHVALESIYSGFIECAIVGGVNLIIDPAHYLNLTEITMLSSGKQCKAFGEQADGFVAAEGVGAIILKPLGQAQHDGDHIYAVIKGSAVNAGGRTNGYTVPNPKAQAKVVARALERANVTAGQISYVEAHGTGTALGDPIEIAGLTRAFKETTDKKQFCSIGSLKSNIGHCESAAGIAGLTKVLLQLKYGELAPSLHSEIPNGEIDFGQTPFKIQKSLEKWPRPLCEVNGVVHELPRIAGVSSFGAGGSNAHVIVQEYRPPVAAREPVAPAESAIIIALSARTVEQLKQKARDLLVFICDEEQRAGSSDKSIDLVAIAYTLLVGREAMEARLGLVVSSIEQLSEKLQAYLAGEQDIAGVYQGQATRHKEALWLFSTDADLQQTVDKWMADRKLSKLLELWVKGLELDWSKLYVEARPRRLSLPTYPFAKERYWMDTVAGGETIPQGATTVILHPLLHSNTSDLSEQRYSSIFTGEEFFFADHLVKTNGHADQKALPEVAYLEMARAAIERSLPGRPESGVLELRDVVWSEPVVVDEYKQVDIAVLENNYEELDYEIYSQIDNQEIVHCHGRAVWLSRAAPAPLNLDQLTGQMGRGEIEPRDVYSACARIGIVYGQSFHGITAIHLGGDQLVARLRLPKDVEETSGDYVLHPSLMDGALQACVGLICGATEGSNQPGLLFALESLQVISPCSREMAAWVRFSPGRRDEDQVKLDLDLCDEQGHIAVQMRGISWLRTMPGQVDAVVDLAASPAVRSALSEITFSAPARREIVFVPNQPESAAPVEQKKPAAISLVALSPLASTEARASETTRRQRSTGSPPITLSIPPSGAATERRAAPAGPLIRLYDDGGGILSIQIDTPVAGDTSAKDVIALLLQALERAQLESSVKVLLVKGVERCFGRGGRKDYNEALEQKLYQAIISFPYPVIAVLECDALGAGFLFAALCDFMVCNEDAQYGYTDTQRHFYPTIPEANLFGERFGEVRAQDLLYLSTAATGKQLRRKGWTCPILPAAQTSAYAEKLARSMAMKSRDALRLLKQHLTRRLVGLVQTLTCLEIAADAAENPAAAETRNAANNISSPAKHIDLDTSNENILVIKIRCVDEYVEAAGVVANLGKIFAEVDQNRYYKAIVLKSEYPNFLPGTEHRISVGLALEFQRLITESEIPVVAVLAGNARGPAWLASLFCDACVYSRTGVYSSASIGQSWSLMQTAAAIFAHRYGGEAANEILLTAADYSGADLQRRVCALIVAEQDQVEREALKVAELWAQLPLGVLAAWKKQTAASLREKIGGLGARDRWEEKEEGAERVFELQDTEPTPIALDSQAVTATAYLDGIVVVKMEDRKAKNMFSDALVAGVTEAFAHIERTPGYKVVILTGYESYFASGGTKERLLEIQEGKVKFTDIRIFQAALECKLPVIAAMQGHAIGAGLSMGMFADIVLLSEESRYVSPYLEYGFTPGAGATWIMAEKMGEDLARENLLTARDYAGSELKERGLKLAVLPQAEVYQAALSLAKQIARATRQGLIGLKRQLTGNVLATLEETYRLELAMHEKTFVGRSDTLAQIQNKFYQASEPHRSPQVFVETATVDSPPSIDNDSLPAITETLRMLLADELQMRESEIDENAQFVDLGLDSISGVTWIRKINDKYLTSIEATKVYSYPTLVQFSRYVKAEAEKHGVLMSPGVSSNHLEHPVTITPELSANGSSPRRTYSPESATKKLASRRRRAGSRITGSRPTLPSPTTLAQPIAVIGMAGQFPQARKLEEFWQNIAQGRNCITEVPSHRWNVDVYYQSGDAAPGKTNSRWAGLLDEYDLFDPLFFEISPTEAESMDPQQRLFLQACWHSIENAGYAARSLFGSKCGVFVGCSNGEYHELSRGHKLSAQGFTGGANSILAARISYFLNLQGPSIAIDTACSSSLVAMAQACDSLNSGASDMALAGGVYVMTGPEMHIRTAQTGMLSPEGKCYTFDQRADGFVPGEGVGVVVLKRLADAEKDHDIIHAVIEGWGVNQDGRTNGITAPNPESQTRLEQEVYDRFGIDPGRIQLIEAHGTGTKLGDPIEVEGLKKAFEKYTENRGYCALGSVKSNIGHCLTAAGIAGVIKLLLALKHRKLPPTINFDQLNEHIDLQESPFYVNTRLQEWYAEEGRRRQAAISSFGFSGTNAHLVIGEYLPQVERPRGEVWQKAKAIIPLSAKTPEQLKQKARDLSDFIHQSPAVDLVELAYTLQVGREAMDERLGVAAISAEQLAEKLETYLKGERRIEDLYRGQVKHGANITNIINQDDDVKETIIEKWIGKTKYSRLLELWVNGVDLDWNRLYGEIKPQRLELPIYPFARERYWIDSAAVEDTTAEAAPVVILHPLLHSNTSDLTEQRYSSTFSGEEFFLTDHRVRMSDGAVRKLLPGAACLEMARAAIEHALPSYQEAGILELHSVVWLKPVVVTASKQVSIALFANDDADGIDYELYTIEAGQKILHFQGQARFSPHTAPARHDLDRLRRQMGQGKLEAAEVYSIFARMGLDYGPAHRGITVVNLGGDQVLAQLRLPEGVESSQYKYVLHPSLIDSALQSSIGLIIDSNNIPTTPYLPFGVESLSIRSACTKQMVARVRYSQGSKPGDKIVKFDIDLCDQHDNLCVQMRGFAFRVLSSEIFRSAQNGMTLSKTPFDSAFYRNLIARVRNGEMSVDEAVELG